MAKIKICLSTEIRNGSIPANNIILYIQLHDIVFDYTNSILLYILHYAGENIDDRARDNVYCASYFCCNIFSLCT